MRRRHLFLCPTAGTFGEMTLGLRLAREVHARGEDVTFLAPAAQAQLLRGTPFAHLVLERAGPWLPSVLGHEVRRRGFDDVVLVDLTATLVALALAQRDARFLGDLGVPVAALDIWSLDETDHVWDAGPDLLPLPRAEAVRVRARPAPFVRPTAPGAFVAAAPAAPPARAPGRERQILLTTARWQTVPPDPRPHHLRLVDCVPELLLAQLARLGARVLHVGPRPFACGGILGERYRFQESVAAGDFDRLLAESDLLLTLNQASTVLARALAFGVPAAAVICSHAGATVDEVAALLPAPPGPALRAALAGLVPLSPFRLWPLGLFGFMTPALRGNPFVDVVPALELLDEEGLVATCAELMADSPRREALVARGAAYLADLAALPGAAEVLAA